MTQSYFDFYNDVGVIDTFHPSDYRYGKVKYGLTAAFWA